MLKKASPLATPDQPSTTRADQSRDRADQVHGTAEPGHRGQRETLLFHEVERQPGQHEEIRIIIAEVAVRTGRYRSL